MARDLDLLVPEFREPYERALAACARRGIDIVPFFTQRTPWEQARLWRGPQSSAAVSAKVARYRAKGAHWLADVLESVGPQNGPRVTRAGPGESWPQFCEAADGFWRVNGKAAWTDPDPTDDVEGYSVLAEEVRRLGLTSGASFGDKVHTQLRAASAPTRIWSFKEIERRLRDLYGDEEPG